MKTITLLELRQFKGFENIDEKKGWEIINLLVQFSIITYNFFYRYKTEQ